MAKFNIRDNLVNLLATYKNEAARPHVELEIRLKNVTRDVFEALYEALPNRALECSVNIISENLFERGNKSAVHIRKLVFAGQRVESEEYSTKTRIVSTALIDDYIKYTIGVAREAVVPKFITSTTALVRFKLRISALCEFNGNKWRLDLTAVKQGSMSEMGERLKSVRDELFAPAMTADNFLPLLKHDLIDSYEIELEYVGEPSALTVDSLYDIKFVFAMINPGYVAELSYQDEIYNIATYLVEDQDRRALFKQDTHRLKQLCNQVIALNKTTYLAEVFPAIGMYLTDKANGQRALISVSGGRCRIVKSDDMQEFGADPGEVTIADAELLTIDGEPHIRVFEALVVRDRNLTSQGIGARIAEIDAAVAVIAPLVPMPVFAATWTQIEEPAEKAFRLIHDSPAKYTRDGLILAKGGDSYGATKNYKWKSYEDTTIDFLAVKCPRGMLGIKPYIVRDNCELYLLFVGIRHDVREKLGLTLLSQYRQIFPGRFGGYYPIQFSPSVDPYAYLYWHTGPDIDRKIVELSRNADNTGWKFDKIRTDRSLEKNYFGNDFRTAELTYINYFDRFNFDNLWLGSSSYFVSTADARYMAGNKFRRYVISLMLRDHLSGARWVIDEGAGRGADLHRYQEIGVKNALFIDNDSTAIAELIRRKFSMFEVKRRHVQNWYKQKRGGGEYNRVFGAAEQMPSALTVHTLVSSLKLSPEELMASTFQYGMNPGGVDGIVCNFALHYMCDTIEHMRGLLTFNARMLRRDGVFMFIVMDGKLVFNLLKNTPTSSRWELREDGVVKYALRKQYVADTLLTSGQTISVMLPFSTEMYEEPLCNVDAVVTEARKLGFKKITDVYLADQLEQFERADKNLYAQLTPADKEYSSLFRIIVLKLESTRAQ